MEITSTQNPRVKEWSELLSRKGRERQGKLLLEGTHMVLEALQSGVKVESMLYLIDKGIPSELEFMLDDVERIAVSKAVLSKCSDTETPQGVIGIAGKPAPVVERLLDDPRALVIAVDGLQDPGNLGTIIRTADAAGASGVVLGKGTVDPYNPKSMRSTMGSLFHIPVVEVSDSLASMLDQARARGAQVFTTGMNAAKTCFEEDYSGATWFVIGSEGKGVSSEVQASVGSEVSIPMPGKAESLNAAMAAGILLYEAVRQRMS